MAHGLSQRHDRLMLKPVMCKLEQVLYVLVIVPLVAFLPAPLAYRIACLRGDWRYGWDTFTRERFMRSLAGVLGDQLSSAECARVTRDSFRRRSCEALDVLRLAWGGRALARLVEIRGLEHVEAALAAGKGAVLCSAHFGSFNIGFSLIGACGYPITVVGDWKSESDPGMSLLERLFWRLGLERRMARHRRRPNIQPQKGRVETAIQMVEILRSNEVIAISIDTPTLDEDSARAVPVDFLGRQILLLPGSVSIAQHTGSPVLVMVARRLADWRHQVLEIAPVPLEGDAVMTFKHCVAMVEAPIRQNPAYWTGWENPQELVDLGLLSTW